MAVVAIRATRNVVEIFSGRYDAVMARAARTDYLSMVDNEYRSECRTRVTVLADVSG